MFCSNCGAEVESNQKFCIKCGSIIHIKKDEEIYLYELKKSLMSNNEMEYYKCIKEVVPVGYCVQPQVNLASFIVKNDNCRFQNELFRNVDFLIMDKMFKPVLVIEINDKSHFKYERKRRDEKVEKICEEAGIPIMRLWTSYGINQEYIKKKIVEKINSPVIRKHNFEGINEMLSNEIPETITLNQFCLNNTHTFRNMSNNYKLQKNRLKRRGNKTCLSQILTMVILVTFPFWSMMLLSVIGKILEG